MLPEQRLANLLRRTGGDASDGLHTDDTNWRCPRPTGEALVFNGAECVCMTRMGRL
jgi:hypothetical protein